MNFHYKNEVDTGKKKSERFLKERMSHQNLSSQEEQWNEMVNILDCFLIAFPFLIATFLTNNEILHITG